MSRRWQYPAGATPADRDRLDEAAAEHGMAERDGDHDDYDPQGVA